MDVEGIVRDQAGLPTGELAELAAMFPIFRDYRRSVRDGTRRASHVELRLRRTSRRGYHRDRYYQ